YSPPRFRAYSDGVSILIENGTLYEIKKAYKQLARKYHPDVSRRSARRSVTPEPTEGCHGGAHGGVYQDVHSCTRDIRDLARPANQSVRSDGEWKNRWQAQVMELK
ncbi:hypothetical protein RJ640_014491, partial [Escallonia rubra]